MSTEIDWEKQFDEQLSLRIGKTEKDRDVFDLRNDIKAFIRKIVEEQEKISKIDREAVVRQMNEHLRLSRERIDEACIDFVDKNFPKGECQERGAAIVLYAEMLITICQLQEWK